MDATLREFRSHLERYFAGLADLDRHAVGSRAVIEVPWDLEFLMHGGEPGIEVTCVHPFRIASPDHPGEEEALAEGASVAEVDGDTGYDGVPNKDGQVAVVRAKAAAPGLELICPTVAEEQAGYVSPGVIRVRYVPSADAVLDHASILRSYLAARDSLRSAWQVAEEHPEIISTVRVDFRADLWIAWQLVPWEPSREVGDWTALLPLVDGYSAGPDFFDTRPEEEVMEELEALKPQWRYWASHDTPRYSFAVAPGAGDILRIGISGQCAQPVETLLAHLAQVGKLSPNAALWALLIGHCEACRRTGQHPDQQDQPNGCRAEYLSQAAFRVEADFRSYDLSQDWRAHVQQHTGLDCIMAEPEVCLLDFLALHVQGTALEQYSLLDHLEQRHLSAIASVCSKRLDMALADCGPGRESVWDSWQIRDLYPSAWRQLELADLGSPQHVTRLVRQQRTDEAKAAAQLAEDRFRTVWASLSEVARDHLKAACYHLTALDRGEGEAGGLTAALLGALCESICASMEVEWKRRVSRGLPPGERTGGGRPQPSFWDEIEELVGNAGKLPCIDQLGGAHEDMYEVFYRDKVGHEVVRTFRNDHAHGGRPADIKRLAQVQEACRRALSSKEEENWLLEYFRALPPPPRD